MKKAVKKTVESELKELHIYNSIIISRDWYKAGFWLSIGSTVGFSFMLLLAEFIKYILDRILF